MPGLRVHRTNATRRPFSRRGLRHNSDQNHTNQMTDGTAATEVQPLTPITSSNDLNELLPASPTELGRLPLMSLSTIPKESSTPEESSTIPEEDPQSTSEFEDIEDSDIEDSEDDQAGDNEAAQQAPGPVQLTFARSSVMTTDEMARSGRFNSILSNSLTPTNLTFFSTMQQNYSDNPFAATFDDDSDDYPSSPESASRPKPPKKKTNGTSPTPSIVVNSVRDRLEALDRNIAAKLKITPAKPDPAKYSMPNVIESFKSRLLPDPPVRIPAAPANRYIGYAYVPPDVFKPEVVVAGGFTDYPREKTPIDLSRTRSVVSLSDRAWISWAIKEPIPKQNPFPEFLYGPW